MNTKFGATQATGALTIRNAHVNEAEMRDGAEAARELLSGRGFTAQEAHEASVKRGKREPFDEDAARAWDDATNAAFRAAFEGWVAWPEAASLELA
ncbi:hypothetical protein OR214_02357 [Ralstonia pickettii OR214]|jgi:hypothetical protein|uniref:Uncharacterized protein n=2 Tax=Ralstonia pickettii TaxID=329 RepID=R0CN57_RALPI|nr:hypothetical protein OR214_02357 [Ralstonia pickettii OR214]